MLCMFFNRYGYVDEQQNLESCCICLEDIMTTDKNSIITLNCNHVFHEECIQTWKALKNTCPICRRSLMEIKYFPLIDEYTLLKTLEKIQPILLIILQNPKWVYGSIMKAIFEREST